MKYAVRKLDDTEFVGNFNRGKSFVRVREERRGGGGGGGGGGGRRRCVPFCFACVLAFCVPMGSGVLFDRSSRYVCFLLGCLCLCLCSCVLSMLTPLVTALTGPLVPVGDPPVPGVVVAGPLALAAIGRAALLAPGHPRLAVEAQAVARAGIDAPSPVPLNRLLPPVFWVRLALATWQCMCRDSRCAATPCSSWL
jgi:hypothetical protein